MNDHPSPPAGWFPDPLGRYDHRWFNGTSWTADVSVRGQRYVDPLPLTGGPAGATHPPSRTLAVLALIGGIAAVSMAALPFFVVLGIIAAVVALVLGVVALRRVAAGTAAGRGVALGGVVLAVLAVGLSPVGIAGTRTAYRELVRFAEPGAYSTAVTDCAAVGSALTVAGTIENLSDGTRDYVVEVTLSDDGGLVDRVHLSVDGVSPGSTATWTSTATNAPIEGTLRCRVAQVTGPYPFGIDPPG